MKQEITSKYVRRITVRFKPEEFERLQRHYKSTTCRKLSQYSRKILLNKPVVVNYRNQSVDEILAEMIQLKVELSALGNNFNQAVKKLHTLDQIPEFRAWVLLNEASKQSFLKKVEEIKIKMNKLYETWSQK